MKFRTEISAVKPLNPIVYKDPILMMGSCFTENVGALFKKYLFHVSVNPFGVMFNPLSIKNGIDQLLTKEAYETKDLDFFNELYFSFDHYTKYSDPNKEKALEKINEDFLFAKKFIPKAGTLILTFGSAYIYEHVESGKLVNNCHKIPASKFSRRMLTTTEIVSQYKLLIEELFSLNPKLKILFTVSPVRHLKDGFIENQHSKSTLLLAIKYIIELFPETCSYFPSYEIMMDDLRDYRYYANDMLHPSEKAIDYIWEYFVENNLDHSAKEIMKRIDPLLNALGHRPMNVTTKAYRKFSENLITREENLRKQYPYLNWTES